MGNLQFSVADWGARDADRVARELLAGFMKHGVYSHMTHNHQDIFCDYDALVACNKVTGLYFVRDMGTHTIFLERFEGMSGGQSLLDYTKATLATIGTRMVRAFVIVDTENTRGDRLVNVEEFNPEYGWDLERIVKTLENIRYEKS